MDRYSAISELFIKLADLTRTVKSQASEITLLKRENTQLRERLAKFENPKNSLNSSIPPSLDGSRPKRNQSLRKGTGRKPGGQPGHKGNTLKMTPYPDHIVELRPDLLPRLRLVAGKGSLGTGDGSRQSGHTADQGRMDGIPFLWCAMRVRVPTVADFPGGAGSPVSYDSNIEGLIGYFHARQYLPFERMGEMMGEVFNIDIGEGGIHYLLGRFADRATPHYETIRQRVAAAKVVGTDETGMKVDGGKAWFWTWQNARLTCIVHSDTRGKAAVDGPFPARGSPGPPWSVTDGGRRRAPSQGTTRSVWPTCRGT